MARFYPKLSIPTTICLTEFGERAGGCTTLPLASAVTTAMSITITIDPIGAFISNPPTDL
jgi:hypothetical protein